ncbi:MAG: sulfatase-like hydrolase/transferase [Elusimicrobia bacterium]|nr:sulfatase-like hydrolase/transferase [Elusimicrobiota bacterium]
MKKSGFQALKVFLGCNFALSLAIGLGYFLFVGSHPAELAFSIIAYLSNTAMIYAVLSLPALALFFAGAGRAPFAAVFAFLQLSLVVDVAVYKIFRFHINSMVVNLILTPGGLQSLDQGLGMKILFFAVALGLLALELWFYSLAARSGGWFAAAFKKRTALILGLLLLFIIADKALFAWGALYDAVYITGNPRLFPLYQPLKIRTFAGKYLGVRLDREVSVPISKKYSKLDYPKIELDIMPPARPLNVLVIITDSFRYDMLDREITPELWAFSKKAAVFTNHYSGGNCTRFGIFSILYGIYGNYWFSMAGERRPPVMMDAFAALGYEFSILASAKLSFPEFNKTCFANVPREDIYDEPKSAGKDGKDREITDKFLEFLKARTGKKPYFAFIFYDASHGSYDYPPEFEKFKPAGGVNYLALNKDNAPLLFNKYRNSIHYEDSLIGDILRFMEKNGDLKDTAVLVTGDHGEPFFEKGYFGHNQGYSEEEVKVPLVFYLPGRAPRVITGVTSHLDIVPTLLKLAGTRNPPADYSSGLDLFEKNSRPFICVFSWDTSAMIKDGSALVMPLEAYGGGVKIYDKDYKAIPGKKAFETFSPHILNYQREAKRFYK